MRFPTVEQYLAYYQSIIRSVKMNQYEKTGLEQMYRSLRLEKIDRTELQLSQDFMVFQIGKLVGQNEMLDKRNDELTSELEEIIV
jgi:hypothetical protein